MADSKHAAKSSKEPKKEPKKQPKKLIIVDASDTPVGDKAPLKKKITVTEHAGDTPALSAKEAELASLAEAINKVGIKSVTTKEPEKVVETPPAPSEHKKIVPVTAEDDDTSDVVEPELDETMTIEEAMAAAAKAEDDTIAKKDSQGDETEESSGDEAEETNKIEETEETNEDTNDNAKADDKLDKRDETEDSSDDTDESTDENPEDELPEIILHNAKPDIAPAKKTINLEEEFGDPATSRQVDDIVAKEADELLAREDAESLQKQVVVKKHGVFKRIFSDWWVNPATKWGSIVGIFLVLLGIASMPQSRYLILNAAGVRVSSSLTVTSTDSQQPLKNVSVTLDEIVATTDDKGSVTFTGQKLGKHTLVVTKRGYEKITQTKVFGWGSNPLGQITLSITGTQFNFIVRDFLSNKILTNASAVSGDYNADANKDGKVTLAVDQNNDKNLEITIKVPEYKDLIFTVKPTDLAEKTVRMVPAKQHIFVSKRNGKLDIYKIDADGKNEALLLAATGSERDDLALLPHPTDTFAAVVSTRENVRNKDGYLLSTIYTMNTKTGELSKIIQSERIQLIDWTGNRIIFIAVAQGVSAANPSRSKLYSYEIGQPGPKTIATANYFNDAVVFKGYIYYAPSSYAIPVSSVKFFKVNPDSSNQVTVLDKEVWNIFRSGIDELQLSVQQDWYTIKNNDLPIKLVNAPANPKSRTYRESPDRLHSLWRDDRDGKGVLLSVANDTKKEDVVHAQAGLGSPFYWLNSNTFVYRISDGHETADYIKSIDGGDAKKLRDVTATDVANYFN